MVELQCFGRPRQFNDRFKIWTTVARVPRQTGQVRISAPRAPQIGGPAEGSEHRRSRPEDIREASDRQKKRRPEEAEPPLGSAPGERVRLRGLSISIPAAIASSFRTRSRRSASSIRPVAGGSVRSAESCVSSKRLRSSQPFQALRPAQPAAPRPRMMLAPSTPIVSGIHHFSSCGSRSFSISRASSSFWVLMW